MVWNGWRGGGASLCCVEFGLPLCRVEFVKYT